MSNNTEREFSLSEDPQAAIAEVNDAAGPGAPDGLPEEILFDARKTVTFRCGKSSLTLHASGKITLEADHIYLIGERTTRIAGGQISLN